MSRSFRDLPSKVKFINACEAPGGMGDDAHWKGGIWNEFVVWPLCPLTVLYINSYQLEETAHVSCDFSESQDRGLDLLFFSAFFTFFTMSTEHT